MAEALPAIPSKAHPLFSVSNIPLPVSKHGGRGRVVFNTCAPARVYHRCEDKFGSWMRKLA